MCLLYHIYRSAISIPKLVWLCLLTNHLNHWTLIEVYPLYYSPCSWLCPFSWGSQHRVLSMPAPGGDANYQSTSCGNKHTCSNVPWGPKYLLASTWTGLAGYLLSRCWTPAAQDHLAKHQVLVHFRFQLWSVYTFAPDNFIFAGALDGYCKLQSSWYLYFFNYLFKICSKG